MFQVMLTQAYRRRFSIEDVQHMLSAGILHEDEPVELLEGELIVMSPQGAAHSALLTEIRDLLAGAYRGRPVHIRVQCPLIAGAESLPEPDLAVVRGAPREYLEAHPAGRDALLVVEVAATSQAVDRAKAGIYAAAGVPALWLLDLAEGRLEVHTEPGPGGYRFTRPLTPERGVHPPRHRGGDSGGGPAALTRRTSHP